MTFLGEASIWFLLQRKVSKEKCYDKSHGPCHDERHHVREENCEKHGDEETAEKEIQ